MLTLYKEKCQFSMSRITFLGQIIDGSGVLQDSDKVPTSREIGTPGNVSDMLCSLGMYNQLSNFVPTWQMKLDGIVHGRGNALNRMC